MVTPLTRTTSVITLDEKRRCQPNNCTELHQKKSHGTSSTLPEGDHGKWDGKSPKGRVSEKLGVSSSNPWAASDFKSKDTSKKSLNSKKLLKVLGPVTDRFNTPLNYKTYRLIEHSPRYDDEITKHVSKWCSILQVHMNAQIFHSVDPSWKWGSCLRLKWRMWISLSMKQLSCGCCRLSWASRQSL